MGTTSVPRDPQIINLNRLLAAQERQLLSELTNPETFKSRYQRARIRANFDYARSLLLTASSTRQLSKEDIARKKDLVKRLQTRLNELDQTYADVVDEVSESEEAEDELDTTVSPHVPSDERLGLRQRGQTTWKSEDDQATSTANRYSKPIAPQAPDLSDLQSKEQKLSADNRERDELSVALLSLATQLKSSVRGFGAMMESDKSAIEATTAGLDKTIGGMEGAGGKMKQLGRETEGAGWFRRMRLYVEVGLLWLAAVLLVFVGPKLRF